MNKTNLITLLILVVIIAGAAWFAYQAQNPGENTDNSAALRSLVGSEAEQIKYTDLNGLPVELGVYEGKVRVVNSWATWCPFCVAELKDFETLASEVGEEVVVIAINRSEPNEKAKAFLQQLGEFNQVIFVQDPDDQFYRSVGGFAMPETLFYSQDGTLVKQKRGFMELDEMRELTAAAVAAGTN